jgi:hypothetical protein
VIFRGSRGRWLALFVLVGVVSMGLSWLAPDAARGDDKPTLEQAEPPKPSTGAGRIGQNFLSDPKGGSRFQGVIGYFLLIGIAYAVSRKK